MALEAVSARTATAKAIRRVGEAAAARARAAAAETTRRGVMKAASKAGVDAAAARTTVAASSGPGNALALRPSGALLPPEKGWTFANGGGAAEVAAADEYAVPAFMRGAGGAGAAAATGEASLLQKAMPFLRGAGRTATKVGMPALVAWLLYSILNSGNKGARDLGLPHLDVGSAGEADADVRAGMAEAAIGDRDQGDLDRALMAEQMRTGLISNALAMGESTNEQLAHRALGDALDMRRVAVENRRSLADATVPAMPTPRELMAMMSGNYV